MPKYRTPFYQTQFQKHKIDVLTAHRECSRNDIISAAVDAYLKKNRAEIAEAVTAQNDHPNA